MIGPSRTPLSLPIDPPDKRRRRIDKGNKEKKEQPGTAGLPPLPQKGEKQETLRMRRAQPVLVLSVTRANPIAYLLRGLPSGADAPHPGVPQKSQHRFRGPLLPQPLNRGDRRLFPPAGLPNVLPQPCNLRTPDPALREQVVAVCCFPPPHHQHWSSSALWICPSGMVRSLHARTGAGNTGGQSTSAPGGGAHA